MSINSSPKTQLKWRNNRNWLKLKILSLCLQYPRDVWVTCKNLQRDFQEAYNETPTTGTLYSILKRYHSYGLVNRRKYQGMQVIYQITDKGVRRFFYLTKYYLKPMFEEYRDNQQFFAQHVTKINNDFNVILEIYSNYNAGNDIRRALSQSAVIWGDEWDWKIFRELAIGCGVIEDEGEKRQCLRDIKRVRKTIEAARKQVKAEREAQDELHPLDLRAPVKIKELEI